MSSITGSASRLVKFDKVPAEAVEFTEDAAWESVSEGDDDVLIKVLAAGINMSDVKQVTGLMPFVKTPIITGRDYCGIVEQGPADLLGKHVFGTGGSLGYFRDGTHAQFLRVPASHVAIKPESISVLEAGTLGVPFLTAHLAVVDSGRIQSGEVIAITGAHGFVGQAALMIAKAKGATTIAMVRRDGDASLPYADHVINVSGKTDEELVKQLQELGRPGYLGVDVFVDVVGGDMCSLGLSALGRKGRLATMAAPNPAAVTSFKTFEFYRKQATLCGINTLASTDEEVSQCMRDIAKLFDEGKLEPFPVSDKTFTLDKYADALEFVGNAGTKDRVAVTPWPELI
eukprot:CAMPEP_0171486210 /NCGR_PEP_ID=MMETSP0958-20121227/967_1 /TAXON_ID=87120 /ORGANISM="Aurantiochytrium limacinum, Strain ATCCMYA-1381" /LENGTH=342 /DNA_ID=CAMNT_0012019071 /DNA_START=73 /DNA_END=1101 /DNA_ORIENTATION=+